MMEESIFAEKGGGGALASRGLEWIVVILLLLASWMLHLKYFTGYADAK